MLYETIAQPIYLFWICLSGFASGIIFDFATFFYLLFEKNKIARFILDILATILVAFVFFILILNICYGEIRLWQILFFTMSFCLERATIGKLVAKAIYLCYNFIINILQRLGRLIDKIFSKKKKEHNE